MKFAPAVTLSHITLSTAIALYIGLILNAVTLTRNTVAGAPYEIWFTLLAAVGLVASVVLLLSLSALLGRWLYKLFAVLLVLCSAAASYYMIFFHVVVGYGVLISVLNTDTNLSKESLGYKFILWFIVTGVLPSMLILTTRIRHSTYSKIIYSKNLTRFLVSNVKHLIAIVTSGLITFATFNTIERVKERIAIDNNTYTPSPAGMVAHAYLPTNWITSLALFGYQKTTDSETADKLYNPVAHFSYTPADKVDDVYVVVVIGETTRADHMGIFGYSRNTTPLLAQEKNLIPLRAVSCDTETSLSLRCMFVRRGGTNETEDRSLKELNVFSVLKQLGFSSELFAMQSEMWFYKSTAADSYKFREVLADENADKHRPIDDMLLVDEVKRSIATHPQGKHLIILHTKGSHFVYSERYPRSFARYTPECKSIDDACATDQMINSFDNSVLYIDTMLTQVMATLKDKKAMVIYSSDHGESISQNEHFHATPRIIAPPEQFRVPMILWMSDKFIQSSPARSHAFHQLQQQVAQHTIAQHDNIFDSLLGCLGYTSPNGGIVPQRNLCSPAYHPTTAMYPRIGAYALSTRVGTH